MIGDSRAAQVAQFRNGNGRFGSGQLSGEEVRKFGGNGVVNGDGGFVRGEIISVKGETVTVKLPDGGSKLILISSSTNITTATEGSVDDLKEGENVMVVGKENSDGSMSAESVNAGGRFDQPEQPVN